MKEYDINKVYTQKVAEYLQNGYTINPATMGGSQGEVAKIDLVNDVEVIRILLTRGMEPVRIRLIGGVEFEVGHDVITLTVGRRTDKALVKNQAYDQYLTIWNNNLDIVEERKFFKLGKSYYVEDCEIARTACQKRYNRLMTGERTDCTKTEKVGGVLGGRARYIASQYLQRKGIAKRPRLDKITVEKKTSYNCKERWYLVSYNGRQFTLA